MLSCELLWHSLAYYGNENRQSTQEVMVTTRDTEDNERGAIYIKADATDFSREMLHRHAIVLKGIAKDININTRSFTLKRPDSSHFVTWSSDTEFLLISPSTLDDATVFVRGQAVNGRFLAESIASSE